MMIFVNCQDNGKPCVTFFLCRNIFVVRERMCQALTGSSEKSEEITAVQFKYSAVKIEHSYQTALMRSEHSEIFEILYSALRVIILSST